MALIMEQEKKDSNFTKQTGKKKLVYKTLSGVRLKKPVRLQMWLDINKDTFGSRTNPQCVHWSTLRGYVYFCLFFHNLHFKTSLHISVVIN